MTDALDIDTGVRLAVGTAAIPEVIDTEGGWRRARPGDGAAEALVRMLGAAPGQSRQGAFTVTSWTTEPAVGERPVTAHQTNESVIVGDAVVVKWATHLQAGPHPAPHRISVLRDAGFTGMPTPLGLVTWQPPGAEATLVATVDEYLPGAADGWTWVVQLFAAAARTHAPGAVGAPMTALGELVADLHAALAGTAGTADVTDARRWYDAARLTLETACVHSAFAASRRAEIDRLLMPLAELSGAVVIEAHGDLHVGQILRAADRFVVTDFDGNPVLAAAERVLPVPAALDVAGMAQSLAHVAIVARRHHELDAADTAAVEAAARRIFLAAYRSRLETLGRSALFDPTAVDAFRVQQVLREIVYAAEHLPRWMFVPDAALPALLKEVRTCET